MIASSSCAAPSLRSKHDPARNIRAGSLGGPVPLANVREALLQHAPAGLQPAVVHPGGDSSEVDGALILARIEIPVHVRQDPPPLDVVDAELHVLPRGNHIA